jgi:predicted aldo/keto reductase-like oxidoreductase
MLYRRMNHTDAKLSILGFGCLKEVSALFGH